MGEFINTGFSGFVFVLDLPVSTKIAVKNQYQNFIKSNGGNVDFVVSPKTTHFITHNPSGFKAQSATKAGACILLESYLQDCIEDNSTTIDIFSYIVNNEKTLKIHPTKILSNFTFILNQVNDLNKSLKVEKLKERENVGKKLEDNATKISSTHSSTFTSSSIVNNSTTPASPAKVSGYQSILNQRKLELEAKNKELQKQIQDKQNEKTKLLEIKKKEKEEKLILANQEKEKKIQSENERRKAVLLKLGISSTPSFLNTPKSFSDTLSFNSGYGSFTSSYNKLNSNNRLKKPKAVSKENLPTISKKQLKKEKREQEEQAKKSAKEERTRVFHETKDQREEEERIKSLKEKDEAYQQYLIREDKRKKKRQLEMEARGEFEPIEAVEFKEIPDSNIISEQIVPKDLRKIFVGGIDFTELSSKYARKPKQLLKLKEKKKSLLLHQFNQFGEIDERVVRDKDHFFIVYKDKESAEKAFKYCSELANRNIIKSSIDSVISEYKLEPLLTSPKFYVRLVKSKNKAEKQIEDKANKSIQLDNKIKEEIRQKEEEEFADWDIA